MPALTAQLTDQVLSLSPQERTKLVALIVDSLPLEGENPWSPEVVQWLQKLTTELRTGRMKALTFEQVFGEKF